MRVATIVVLVAILGSCQACSEGNDFSFLELVQQWPPTNCQASFCNATDAYFTLHGLWPSTTGGDGPCTCTNEQFDQSKVQSLLPELNKYWPSYASSDNAEFWSHEYTKHGTCAEALTPLDSEFNFFKGTLNLLDQYNVLPMLTASGVFPSNDKKYSEKEIGTAIFNKYGHYGVFTCSGDSQLEAISLCLDKDLQPADCPSSLRAKGCDSDISLPAAHH